MTAEPTLALWLRTFIVLGGGVVLVTLLAALAAWPMRSGVGRRTIWQAATLTFGLLLLVELSGVSVTVCAWLSSSATEVGRVELPVTPPAPAEIPVGPPLELEELEPASDASDANTPAVWWPGFLWLLGTALIAGWFAVSRLMLLRMRQQAVSDFALAARCEDIARRVGVRRRVRLVECDGLLGPAAFGVLWPTVAVPAQFTEEFSPAQQEVVLAHELGHLAGADPAWRLLSDLLTAALWWHPLVWEARLRLRTAGEEAADEASVVVPDGPAVLADCLVQLGRRLTAVGPAEWARMAGSGFRSGLARRVQRLLTLDGQPRRSPDRRARVGTLVLMPLLLSAAVVVAMAWAQAPAAAEGDVPMNLVQHSWRRSVAAVILVAALGSSSDSVNAQPPGGGGVPGLGGPPPEKPAKTLDEKLKAVDDEAKATAMQRDALGEQIATLKQLHERHLQIEAQPGRRTAEIERQIRALETQAQALAEQVKALQAQAAVLKSEEQRERAPRIKVFPLAHRDPGEVFAVLTQLLPQHGGGEGGMAGMGPMGGVAPPGGGMGPPPGMMGGGGGPMGMGMVALPTWRLAVSERTRSLIFRGPEAELKMASDLIAMLDVPEGKAPPRMKDVRFFRLQIVPAQEMSNILSSLELGVFVASLPKSKGIVVRGPEQKLKEVAELIAAVDVEGKALRDPESK